MVKVPVIPQDVTLSSIPPQGREGCLDGYKIAFTGIMGEYLSRNDLEELVKQYGGKVNTSIIINNSNWSNFHFSLHKMFLEKQPC